MASNLWEVKRAISLFFVREMSQKVKRVIKLGEIESSLEVCWCCNVGEHGHVFHSAKNP